MRAQREISRRKSCGDRWRPAHRCGAARQLFGRISNRPENTLDLAMETIWKQRKLLALDECVLLVEEEALIERIKDEHHEAGCARETLAHIGDVTASRGPQRDLDFELRVEQMIV